MALGPEPKCGFCDKVGLLLMPARYAIAPLTMGLPPIIAPFKVDDVAQSVGKGTKQDVTLHGSAQYTSRLLRSGYLYVYNEKRGSMTSYWVTADGYYMSFPAEAAISMSTKSVTPCSFEGHRELAGCIAISDAENAGIVWLGYSDVQWTKAVIEAHKGGKGRALRQLHMREFDAGAWAKAHRTPAGAGRGSTPHAVPMSELANTVAEYAQGKPAPGPAFAPSSAPNYRLHAGKAEGVQSSCSRRSPQLQGAIVALDDPAGVAQDLAALIGWHRKQLLDTRVKADKYGAGYGNYGTTYRELTALDGALNTLHLTNNEKVKMQVFADADAFADYMKVSYQVAREDQAAASASIRRGAVAGVISNTDPQDLARQQALDLVIRSPSAARIEAAQVESWKTYMDRLKPGLHETWTKEFAAASDKLRADHVEALAKAHVAWMQSNLLANTLDCTHDGADVLSGDVYAETLQRCMDATQEIKECAAVYTRWLKGDITEKTNLLLRALVLRQDELVSAMAATPLDPASVPWAQLMDQCTKHFQILLRPALNAQMNARAAQTEAANAEKDYAAAFKAMADAAQDSPGVAMFGNNPLRRRTDAAEARVKATKTQADNAKLETKKKLLPDSVATLLVQIAGPVTTAMREFNDAAAEKALARWMAIVGVVTGTPAGVANVSGTARQTIEFTSKILIEHLAKAAEQSGKPLSADQIRQLTTYAQRQVKGGFPSGNLGSFESALGNPVKSKMAVFITDEMHKELKNIPDPTKKVAWLAENVKMPKDLYTYGVLRVGRAPLYGATAEGALTMIDAICKYAAWEQIRSDEAKALTFQKGWDQDVRKTLGGALYVSAIGTGVGNAVKFYGTWRNLYATGMAEQMTGERLAQRAGVALRVAGRASAAVSGVLAAMDFVDTTASVYRNQWALAGLQLLSSGVGITAAYVSYSAAMSIAGGETIAAAGLTLTGWGVVLAVALAAIGMAVDHVKGDNFAQWLERTYWGNLKSGRYTDFTKQQADFNTAMAGA